MPGRSPKRKGNVFERELVKLAIDSGLDAQRAWGSNGASLGWHAEVDVMVNGCRIQAKRRASIAGFMQPTENVDAVALRADNGEALIVLRYSDFLDMLKGRENNGQ